MLNLIIIFLVTFVIVCVAAVVYTVIMCWRRHSRKSADDSDYSRVALVNSISSEALCYAPPLPPYHLPSTVVDDLSDFDFSIMVDQPMVLTKTQISSPRRASDSSSNDGLSSENECCDRHERRGTNIPRMKYIPRSLEKLWNSLEKSTLSLHYMDENNVTGAQAPNTSPAESNSNCFTTTLNKELGNVLNKSTPPNISVYTSATSLQTSSLDDDTFTLASTLTENSSE